MLPASPLPPAASSVGSCEQQSAHLPIVTRLPCKVAMRGFPSYLERIDYSVYSGQTNNSATHPSQAGGHLSAVSQRPPHACPARTSHVLGHVIVSRISLPQAQS